jgi:heme A synthase
VQRSRFRTLALATLGFTLLVILWGAYVRVTGSGAGCGSHWPTCNGEVVPRAPRLGTVIEYTHRLTSGVALLLVVAQTVLAFVWLPKHSIGRLGAGLSMFFMLTEAAVGAGLVLFEKVAHDQSLARGAWMAAHLVNTFLLLASMTLTVWAASRDERPTLAGHAREAWMLGAGVVAMLITGVTGAIAALGDTLFPSSSLAEGLSSDLSHASHPFVQLRSVHPFFAAGTAVLILFVVSNLARSDAAAVRRGATWLGAGIVGQVVIGVVNLLLAAPAFMQLAHLLAADAVWITLVSLFASALSVRSTEARASEPSPAEPPPARTADAARR